MSAVADVLNGAADLIERDGWCQGTPQGDGPVCAGVAICRSSNGVRLQTEAITRLTRHTGWSSVIGWNDSPGRTKTEVVAALRTVAREAK